MAGLAAEPGKDGRLLLEAARKEEAASSSSPAAAAREAFVASGGVHLKSRCCWRALVYALGWRAGKPVVAVAVAVAAVAVAAVVAVVEAGKPVVAVAAADAVAAGPQGPPKLAPPAAGPCSCAPPLLVAAVGPPQCSAAAAVEAGGGSRQGALPAVLRLLPFDNCAADKRRARESAAATGATQDPWLSQAVIVRKGLPKEEVAATPGCCGCRWPSIARLGGQVLTAAAEAPNDEQKYLKSKR